MGKYKSEEMIQCEMCPVGKVSERQGRRTCSLCGDGMMSNPEQTACGECIGDFYNFLTCEMIYIAKSYFEI